MSQKNLGKKVHIYIRYDTARMSELCLAIVSQHRNLFPKLSEQEIERIEKASSDMGECVMKLEKGEV